jgi:acetolactate synthase I/II/III large subunit
VADSKENPVDRRGFLKGAAAGAAALAAQAPLAAAQSAAQQVRAAAKPEETANPVITEMRPAGRPGSDFMLDVIKSLGFEYLCALPGSSFAGLHESVINYGGNSAPEFITCLHEESSVAMANGFAKIDGKPLLVCAHGTVGLQHAAMAIYNSFCDRVPVYVILGNTLDAAHRGGEVAWVHSVQDACSMVRDFVKWDDNPVSLQHFAESAVRAYKIAMTPPMMPVALVADTELQTDPIPADAKLSIPKLTLASPPQGDTGAVIEAAKMLVAAENPVIVASRAARTPQGLKLVIELAETLQAGVIDQHRRMNFPTRHPLNQTNRIPPRPAVPVTVPVPMGADVIIGLEASDFASAVRQSVAAKPAKLITISANELYLKSNYQDFQRYSPVDIAMAADAEATLPALIEEVKRRLTDDRKRAIAARGVRLAEQSRLALDKARLDASYGWDSSPISTARMSAELWEQLRNEDWSMTSDTSWISDWPLRLWDFKQHYQYIGGAGGEGLGYTAPATMGAALANKKHGRLSVAIQCDGDLMCVNGILWTAAHHKIPLLIMMHNNRAYHMEIMGIQRLANNRNRGIDRCHIGTTIDTPNIDYAQLARSMGVAGEGAISDPKDLGPAIRRGIDVVKRGEPYLIDVVTQPR